MAMVMVSAKASVKVRFKVKAKLQACLWVDQQHDAVIHRDTTADEENSHSGHETEYVARCGVFNDI